MFEKADLNASLNDTVHVDLVISEDESCYEDEKHPRKASWQSTAASDGLPAYKSPPLRSRLQCVGEKRGWKHFFKHVIGVPLAFCVGISLGIVATLACVWLTTEAREGDTVQPYAPASPQTIVPPAYLASQPLNNSCLIPNLAIPAGPSTFDACGFVIKSTDEVWNSRGDVDAAIEKYFHEDYLNAGSWGRRGVGKKALREAIFAEMRAFPDIKIHITDCVCKGNDADGYKCAMPDILEGTNTGPSVYGPATGRYARWTGMVQSLVKQNPVTGQWQYYAEWGVHDEWALVQQLGLDFNRVPHPQRNLEHFHDCTPLQEFRPEPVLDAKDAALLKAAMPK